MVGAAQYLDAEIDWVLSAVVGKKKQSYIQTHFHERFGRHLNHNQIRYIKNKYGKDPRFNSPLVNARPPRVAVSPKPGASDKQKDEGEQDDKDDFTLGGPRSAGSSTNKVGQQRGELKDEAAATAARTTRMKRKRSPDDSSDLRERLIKKIAGPQRADTQPERTATPEPAPRAAQGKKPLRQRQNAADLQPSSSSSASRVRSGSPLPLTLADNYLDTLQTGEHHHGALATRQQQQDTLQFLHTSDIWTTPVPRNPWAAAGQTASIMAQILPVTAQYHLPMPPSQAMAFSAPQFSPALPDLAPSPFQHYREQQQPQLPNQITQTERHNHQYHHIDVSSAQPFPHLPITGTEAPSNLDNNNNNNNSLSAIQYQPMPPFQPLPTDTPSSQQHIAHISNLTAAGAVTEHQ